MENLKQNLTQKVVEIKKMIRVDLKSDSENGLDSTLKNNKR